MRVVSLVAGITLLAAGFAALIGRRDDLGAARDRTLESAATLVTTQLDADVARAAAVLTVATPATPIADLAAALGVPVCARSADGTDCTAAVTGLVPPGVVDAASAATVGHAGPVSVVASDAAGATADDRVVVAVDQGERVVVVPVEIDVTELGDDTSADLVAVAGEPLLRARTVGDRRLYAVPSVVDFTDGPWAVRTSTPAAVAVTSDERWLIGTQLAVGAVLAVLALGGILAEHRSLQRRATTDALTKLPNRAEFERRATEALGRLGRDGGTACLMVIDLDQFKVVNDTVGHEAGDRALVDAADRLRRAVRESDLVGRWGGDEFVALLPGIADGRAVPERAATIVGAIAAAPPIGGLELTASVGAALFPAHGRSLESLLRAADRAMYAAKLQGVPHHLAEGYAPRR